MPIYHLRHHAAERLRATHGLAWVQWKPQHWLIAHDDIDGPDSSSEHTPRHQ